MVKSDKEVTCSVRKVFMIINIILGLGLVGLGIYAYVEFVWPEKWYTNPWVIFVPFYSILFGAILIAAEFEIFIIQIYFVFLHNYFGRGIFLIYLATIASGNLPGVDDYVVYIVSGIFTVVGVIYLFFGCFLKRGSAKDQLKESLLDKTSEARKLKSSDIESTKK